MSNSVRTLIEMLLIIFCCVFLIDRYLLIERTDTYGFHHLITGENSVAYVIPLSGGDTAACDVSQETIQALKLPAEIVVTRSLLFGRCLDVSQIRCSGSVCFNESMSHLNANEFIRNAIQFAYYDEPTSVESLLQDYPGYSPEIRRYPNIRGPLTFTRYSVRLPEKLVILDTEGKAQTSLKCGSVGGLCQAVPRRRSP